MVCDVKLVDGTTFTGKQISGAYSNVLVFQVLSSDGHFKPGQTIRVPNSSIIYVVVSEKVSVC